MNPKLEISLQNGTKSTPADIFLPTGSGSNPIAVDVTIVDPLRKELVQKAADLDDYANSYAEKRKESKYSQECSKIGLEFRPISLEIFGKLSPNLKLFISKISTGISNRFGGSLNYAQKDLERRIIITLIKTCSKSVISRIPNRIAF